MKDRKAMLAAGEAISLGRTTCQRCSRIVKANDYCPHLHSCALRNMKQSAAAQAVAAEHEDKAARS